MVNTLISSLVLGNSLPLINNETKLQSVTLIPSEITTEDHLIWRVIKKEVFYCWGF